MGRTLHKGLSAKLYLSMGGCGKVKLRTVRESLTSAARAAVEYLYHPTAEPRAEYLQMSEWIHCQTETLPLGGLL